MNKDKLLIISIASLLIFGVVFLGISMFGEKRDDNHPLPIALACIFIANSLALVRNRKRKQMARAKTKKILIINASPRKKGEHRPDG